MCKACTLEQLLTRMFSVACLYSGFILSLSDLTDVFDSSKIACILSNYFRKLFFWGKFPRINWKLMLLQAAGVSWLGVQRANGSSTEREMETDS